MYTEAVKIVNLTPHDIHFRASYDADPWFTVPASGQVARCSEERVEAGVVHHGSLTLPVNQVRLGQVTGLPDPEPGTIYIVSRLVAEACRDRDDLFIVDDLVRDPEGRVVGCRALARI